MTAKTFDTSDIVDLSLELDDSVVELCVVAMDSVLLEEEFCKNYTRTQLNSNLVLRVERVEFSR